MESCPAQAVLPLVGLAADNVMRDRYTWRRDWIMLREAQLAGLFTIDIEFRSEMRNPLHVVLRPCPRAKPGADAPRRGRCSPLEESPARGPAKLLRLPRHR
ncbi:MAG: hypothetical protein R6U98_00830, partial [Pirellulaceae bacterium]